MPISSDEELNAVILNDLKDIVDEVNLLIYDEVRTSIVDNVYSAYNSPNGWYERLEDRGGLLGSFTTEDAKIDGQTVEARTFHDPFGLFDSRAEMVNDPDNWTHGSNYWTPSKDIRDIIADIIINGTSKSPKWGSMILGDFSEPRDFWTPILEMLQDGRVDRMIEKAFTSRGIIWRKV